MLQYTNEQLATIIGVPIITILLIWTVAIFHKNRKRWNSYDIAIVAVLVQSILRNLTILGYTALLIAKQNALTSDYCRTIVWIFNSVHTFQASSLTTLAVIALFTIKLYRKQQTLQQYLTPTHVIYHLFCLTTLCACVGVAAILAQEDSEEQKASRFSMSMQNDYFEENNTFCKFMPFELDIKFNIFIIVLHIFLAMVSFTSFIFICYNHLKMRNQGFDYLKKSTSDLSELSLSLTASVVNPNENVNNNKNYYDTYTIHRVAHLDGNFENSYESQHHNNTSVQSHNYQNAYCNNNSNNNNTNNKNREPVWNSDLSNISMTVSSTNSKRPCLNKPLQEEEEIETGLHTMYPILAVCYLFNHLPLIILCIFPRLVTPWPVSGIALWMGQLQDILIPIGLGIVDSRFCKWVSKVYKCAERRKVVDKVPPGVGLDGKFRHFGSQPQSLEITQTHLERPRGYSPTEPKFPITNGSLYTSIDGRLPIIHNYRRHKDSRGCLKPPSVHSLNVNIHSSHLKRQEYVRPRQEMHFGSQTPNYDCSLHPQKHPSCIKCENSQLLSSQFNLRNNYPHVNPNFVMQHHLVRRNPSFGGSASPFDQLRHRDIRNRRPLQKRISLSQDSLCRLPVLENMPSIVYNKPDVCRQRAVRNNGRRVGLNNRISKSEDCLNDLQKDLRKFKQNPEIFQKNFNYSKSAKNSNINSRQDLSCISSDDEYFTDSVNLNDTGPECDATSQSSYSITTEANCDFDFFQSKDIEDESNVNERDTATELNENQSFITITDNTYGIINEGNRKTELSTFKQISHNPKQTLSINNFTEEILARSNSRSSKNSITDLSSQFGRNFRITRSNSKRSLENFQAYVDEEIGFLGGFKMQRSNSFMTIEDRKKLNHINSKIRKTQGLENNNLIKTNGYQNSSRNNVNSNNNKNLLQNLNSSIAYLEDMYNHNNNSSNVQYQENYKKCKNKMPHHGGSVPDFKKIFISEYI